MVVPLRLRRAAFAFARCAAVVTACVVATVFGPTARATVLVDIPLPDLIREADVIVRGTVLRSGRVIEVRNGTAEPWTVTTLRVTHWLKGQGGTMLRIAELGAVWPGGGHWIDGTPRYVPGDEVVVLLRDDGEGHLRTSNMALGRFEVRRGVPGVPTTLHRDLGGVGLARWAGGRMQIEHRDHEPAITYDDFVALVRYVQQALGHTHEAPTAMQSSARPVVDRSATGVRGVDPSSARGGAR